ncbi:hypothetical protein HYH02_003795 [Chlamydomonas schloesseri]|uniref:DUF1664 domain-containing protein n=1 Tax=Chlamydomonas schloesseri TaxID=2026947 RepID=A0A835WPY1_9CHLO|nr:hypothetical protein HYH02_003795 [Chlamydomonas schloesseri]|eukprot:KAG2451188.1 hypothetical protein HYH02_003795 [Chlamydomonas schloesseri]
MPSWPTALGGMLFAGYAATQAQKVGIDTPSALVASALKTIGNEHGPSPSGRGSGSELSVLQGEVDRLHRLLSDVVRGQKGGQGYTVIHTGRGGGWSVLILPTALAAGAGYVYIRWRGISVSDFFMVTNKSLQQFRELVSASMTQLWEEMRKQKDEFMARIGAVGAQQQQMMAQQQQMDEKLGAVSANVDDIRDISNTIEARVGQMDHTINIMSTGVQRANEGIYLLCAAVADVTRRVGVDNSRLKMYVQATPPEIADGNPGLRTLLEGMSSGDVSGGSPSLGLITELPADAEVGGGVDAGAVVRGTSSGSGLGALPAANGNGAAVMRSGSGVMGGVEDMRVLYRRDSGAPAAARSGGMLGLFGGSTNTSANRSRTPANAH